MARLLIFARVDPAVGTPSCPDGAVDVELPIMASAGDVIADLQTRGLVREKALAGVRPMGGELLRTGETLADAGVCAQSTVDVVLRLTPEERADLNSKLVNAVAKKQGDAVQTLLEAGADANCKFGHHYCQDSRRAPRLWDRQSPLENAMVIFVQSGRWTSDGAWSVVRALVDGGAELKRSTLHLALEFGFDEMARLIAERGVDVDSQDEMGRTLLMGEMVRTGGVGGFPAHRCLVDIGANLDVQDNDGKTALMHALNRGDKGLIKCLVESGADLEIRDAEGRTALHHALFHFDSVARLLEPGWPYGFYASQPQNRQSGGSGKCWAEAVSLFVDKGVDLDARDKEGRSVLMKCCQQFPQVARQQKERRALVRLLLKRGAKVDVQDSKGMTALMHCRDWGGKTSCAAALLGKGANLDLKDFEGRTAHTHVPPEHKDTCLSLLLRKGADPGLDDSSGVPAKRCRVEAP
eukprot:Hpha_TRINITY_DN16503_c3_g1::TRINITY_DN16503_c3_g1_i7::g.132359::m.132359